MKIEQPTPQVTDEDVKRIVRRDFGDYGYDDALAVIEEYGKQDGNDPSPRVQLAILKLAGGNMSLLRELTHTASQDYRDVIAAAEYPRYAREIGPRQVDEDFAAEVIRDDWKQYSEWLAND